MILKEIIPKEQGNYIQRYDLAYTLEDGSDKIYEIISRKKDLHLTKELRGQKADAVVIIATDASGEKILLNKEFRMVVGEWVYSSSPSEEIVCGFFDRGEVRELLKTAAFAARTQAYCYLWSKENN